VTDTTRPDAAPDAGTPAPTPAPAGNPRTRRRGFLILGALVLLLLAGWGIQRLFFSPPEEETDDAYVAGDVVAVTARDPGTVIAVHADNTQVVRAGQPLIDLDPSTADVNLAAAEADLARAVRSTRADFTRVTGADASIVQAEAELARARTDYARRRGAAAQGAISGEELAHAADAVKVAAATLAVARSGRAQALSSVGGTSPATNPAVLAAAAAYRRAALVRSHMHVVAPVDGTVASRTAQLGQQVAAGAPLLSVVPLARAWVDANFRETQLRDIRIGQPVRITADAFGDDVLFHGRVAGLSAGSGNAFALLPPQNASGNWIKIVQRVPVRIELDPRELNRTPLRLGLSVRAVVDTAGRGTGAVLGRPAAQPYAPQAVREDPAVEARIRRIVAENR